MFNKNKNNKVATSKATSSLQDFFDNMSQNTANNLDHYTTGGYTNLPYTTTTIQPGQWSPGVSLGGYSIPYVPNYKNYYSIKSPFVVDVKIVNLEEFKKYKNEGIVYYDNMLLPFNEFYKLIEERYNKRIKDDQEQALENYNKNNELAMEKYNKELEAYKLL